MARSSWMDGWGEDNLETLTCLLSRRAVPTVPWQSPQNLTPICSCHWMMDSSQWSQKKEASDHSILPSPKLNHSNPEHRRSSEKERKGCKSKSNRRMVLLARSLALMNGQFNPMARPMFNAIANLELVDNRCFDPKRNTRARVIPPSSPNPNLVAGANKSSQKFGWAHSFQHTFSMSLMTNWLDQFEKKCKRQKVERTNEIQEMQAWVIRPSVRNLLPKKIFPACSSRP